MDRLTLIFSGLAAFTSAAVAYWAWVDRPRWAWGRKLRYSRDQGTNAKKEEVTVWAFGSGLVSQVKVWVEGTNNIETRETMNRDSPPIILDAPRPADTEIYRLEVRWRREHPLALNREHGYRVSLRPPYTEEEWKWRAWRWPFKGSRWWRWKWQAPFLTAGRLRELPPACRGCWKELERKLVAEVPDVDAPLCNRSSAP